MMIPQNKEHKVTESNHASTDPKKSDFGWSPSLPQGLSWYQFPLKYDEQVNERIMQAQYTAVKQEQAICQMKYVVHQDHSFGAVPAA